MDKLRIGIFGGSFSPPHLGHRSAAESFASYLNLDKLLIMPAYIPPHKQLVEDASVEERIDMCRLAFSGIEKAEISDLEIKRQGTSYTYLTLEELKNDSNELYLLVGTDMLLTLDKWKNTEKIFSLCTVCYVRRENDPVLSKQIEEKVFMYKEKYNAQIVSVPCNAIELSSTELRNKIASGADISGFIDKNVSRYISERGLYS